ncbi:MAG: hypothetical protein IJA78_00375 [Clostridia bacterium]|nr:hypothetical protein [Clostridia bacterium]
MKNIQARISALLLALVLLVSSFAVLALPAAAEERGSGAVRFVFDSLHAGNTEYAPVQDTVTLSLAGQTEFTANGLSMLRTANATNALYLSLTNASSATRVRLSYEYADPSPKSRTVEHTLTPFADERQSFVLQAPNIGEATALKLSFLGDGAASGTVTLHSCYNLESVTSPAEQEATVEVCRFNAETNTVEVSGTVSYATTVAYKGGMLALFALDPADENLYLSKTPVARTGLSFTFSFSVAVESVEDLFARYVVAAIAKTGERVALCTPYYPSIPVDAPMQSGGFKGLHTDDTGAAIEGGADFEILDVYLDRLESSQSSDLFYIGEAAAYYFDESYISELDRRIRNLSGAGIGVYLRFLISPDAELSYTVFGSPDETENKAIVLTGQNSAEQALLTVYAITDFLTLRYSGTEHGSIAGIVLGRSVDRSLTANYAGAMGLSAYVENYAAVLSLIAGTARRNIPSLHMVVPISDRTWPEAITASDLDGDFCAELFLEALLITMKDRCFAPPTFTVLVESQVTPARIGGQAENAFGIDALNVLLATVRVSAMRYVFLSDKILYSWTPDESLTAEEMRAAYVLHYITLYRNPNVQGFLVQCSPIALEALRYLIADIDTAANARAIAPVLATLGVTSLREIFADLELSELCTRTVHHLPLSKDGYSAEHKPTGSYTLFDFSMATDPLGWYAGSSCSVLSLLTGNNGKALTARLQTDAGGYADIAYSFAQPTDLSFATLWHFYAGLSGDAATAYEIRITLIGAAHTVYASKVVSAGENGELFLDLTEYATALSALRAIRICARPLDGEQELTLTLHTFTLESLTLSDEELAVRIAAGMNHPDDGAEENKRDYTTPIIITVVVVFASIAIAIILFTRYHSKKTNLS